MAADLVVIYTGISVGLLLSHAPNDLLYNLSINQFIVEKSIFILVLFVSFLAVGVYYRRFLTDMKLGFLALAVSHLLALGQLALVFYLMPDFRIWISALGPALVISFAGVLVTHICFDRAVGVELFQKRIVVLGGGDQAKKVQETIGHSPYLNCVGCVPVDTRCIVPPIDRHEQAPSLIEFANLVGADEIVVAVADRREQIPTTELLDCRVYGLQISEFSTFIERIDGRIEIENLKPSAMIYADGFANSQSIQKNVKRGFDLILSSLMLAVTLPIVVIAGIAIYIDSPGPIFYSQTRVGIGGRHFKLWKLRSMHRDAEADGIARWARLEDPRVTRVGAIMRRLRIDEIPQLYNVLKGDMSFVGPRPERPEFVDQLAQEVPFYNYRHTMKPGISGWAQIQYPYGSSMEDAVEKLKYDLYYIKNGNLALDFIVFLQTLRVIIWPNAGTSRRPSAAAQLDLPGRTIGFFDSAP